jgi:tripartite-type tricarboxylate transporter receptor subunit TctC
MSWFRESRRHGRCGVRCVLPILAMLLLASGGQASAQAWPERPITIVVPFAAGGGADVSTRIIAEYMGNALGQSVIVENVAGAGGATGSLRGRNAKPDGYTIGFGHMGTHAASVATNPKLPYDPRTEFDYLGIHAISPAMMIMRKEFAADTLQDFVAYAKKHGKGLKIGHNGAGSLSHLTCVYIFGLIGVEPTYVVYRGFGQVVNDILSGAIDGTCDFIISARNHVEGGSLKAYGVAAPERSRLLPDVPTAKEGGVPDFNLVAWLGLYAPKNLPPAILARLREVIAKALDDPEVIKKMNGIGGEIPPPADRGGQRQLEIVNRDIAHWTEVVRRIGGIEPEKK